MQTSHEIRRGWQAVDRSGDAIGTVEEIGATYIVVSKGLIFTRDIYVPVGRVLGTDGAEGVVRLDIDRDRIDDMGWDHAPLDGLGAPPVDSVTLQLDGPRTTPGTTASDPSSIHDIPSALARWRAAERRFDATLPGSRERAEAEQACDEAHAAYEQLVEQSTVRPPQHDDSGTAGLRGTP